MNAPQIIWIAVISADLGIALSNHGKPRDGKHNFAVTLFAVALNVTLLVWGGFFK